MNIVPTQNLMLRRSWAHEELAKHMYLVYNFVEDARFTFTCASATQMCNVNTDKVL